METPEKKNVGSKVKKSAPKKGNQARRESSCCHYCRIADSDMMHPREKKELRGTGPRDELK